MKKQTHKDEQNLFVSIYNSNNNKTHIHRDNLARKYRFFVSFCLMIILDYQQSNQKVSTRIDKNQQK